MSNIDPTQPTAGQATTQSVRDNFQVAANEIDALQAQDAVIAGEQTTQDGRLTTLETRANETDTEQGVQDGRLDALEAAPPPLSSLPVQDDGVAVVNAETLNFTGAGVTVTDSGGSVAAIDIPGSSILPGAVVQTVHTQDGEFASGTNLAFFDNSIPQISESNIFMNASITPTSATNKLKIEIVLNLAHTSASATLMGCALFQDSGANAIAAGWQARKTQANQPIQVALTHWMTAGTVSSTTFNAGSLDNFGAATEFNGRAGARVFGGVMASSITITEYQV